LAILHLIEHFVIKGLLVPSLIVMPEVTVERLFQMLFNLEGDPVHALVFYAAPETLKEVLSW
jgi:hypothetical protein